MEFDELSRHDAVVAAVSAATEANELQAARLPLQLFHGLLNILHCHATRLLSVFVPLVVNND